MLLCFTMTSDDLESTHLSDTDIDELCEGMVSSQDIQYADKIEDLSIIENILKEDHILAKDLSLS